MIYFKHNLYKRSFEIKTDVLFWRFSYVGDLAMYTIKDVARESGTSIATVSRVINGKSVREENARKILETMERLSFNANVHARCLRNRKTGIVALLIPNLEHVYFMKVAKAIRYYLDKRGYAMLLADSNDCLEEEIKQIKMLVDRNVDGLLIAPATDTGEHLKQYVSKMPIVLLDQILDDFEADAVVPDNINSVYDSVQCFIRSGHKRIGIICGPMGSFTARERLLGYKRAHEDYKFPLNEKLIKSRKYDVQSGYDLMNEFMAMEPEQRPTAIMATNYDITKGALMAVQERDLHIPQDFSFIGYDFEEVTYLFTPKISIIKEDINEIGRRVVDVLCKKMEQEKNVPSSEVYRVGYELIKKDSVQKI